MPTMSYVQKYTSGVQSSRGNLYKKISCKPAQQLFKKLYEKNMDPQGKLLSYEGLPTGSRGDKGRRGSRQKPGVIKSYGI